MKKIILPVVIVEGKTDSLKLKKLFNVNTIETNGSALNNKTLNLINKISHTQGIILLLDPDYAGEKIRKQILNTLDDQSKFINLYISKKDIDSKQPKIGIAEANDEALLNLFKEDFVFNNINNDSLKWDEYLKLNLNSKQKRLSITNKLNISYCNNKQLFKRLNMLNLNYDDILKIINS